MVSPGYIGIVEQGKGNTTINIGVTQTDTVSATIDPFSFLGKLLRSNDTSVQIGRVTYDLSSLGLVIFGKSSATVTNRDQASGIYIDEHASASILGTSESDTTEIGPCGGSTLICPGVNKSWALALSVGGISVGDFLDFSFRLSEQVMLNTIAGTATDLVIVDAKDPFEITEMEIVDANGQVIPGITFTDANGFVFPSESLVAPPGTAVPEPTSAVIFGTALLGLFGLGRFTARRAQA